jgi:large subunit ribosomal protein L18
MSNIKKYLKIKSVRSKIRGTPETPRLSLTISNRHVRAQIIDDSKSVTLVYSDSISLPNKKLSKHERVTSVGIDLATKAKSKKIKKVVFDRRNRRYHGLVKAFADTTKDKGLEF